MNSHCLYIMHGRIFQSGSNYIQADQMYLPFRNSVHAMPKFLALGCIPLFVTKLPVEPIALLDPETPHKPATQ